MKLYKLVKLAGCAVVVMLIGMCGENPIDPAIDPNQAKVELFLENGGSLVVQEDETRKIGLKTSYAIQFDRIVVTSGCGALDTIIAPDTAMPIETHYFNVRFTGTGKCNVTATAYFKNSMINEKTVALEFYIEKGTPAVEFVTTPQPFATHTGAIDTIFFTTRISGGAVAQEYAISSVPALDLSQLSFFTSLSKDTVRILFNPAVADSYTVSVVATAQVGGAASVQDTAHVGVRVYSGISPTVAKAPQNIIAGTADTLMFAVDNSARSDKLTMKLVSEKPLDPAIFTVLSSGSDTVMIAVAATATVAAGTVKIGIATGNGIFIDTSWYPVTFIDKESALWNKTEFAFPVTEGVLVRYDLKPLFTKQPQGSAVAFTADPGSVTPDTFWQYTPAYGGAAAVKAVVTAQKGSASLGLMLNITVTPGDTTPPVVTLADPSINGKKVSSPQIMVNCSAVDKEAGIATVVYSYAGKTVTATGQTENVWSGVISGLENGKATEVTVTATDKSMKKNSVSIKFTVTYDATMTDAEPPVITPISGVKSGERVKSAGGTLVYGISDNTGVDSVWFMLNGTFTGALKPGSDGKYTIVYSLARYGDNTIMLYAQDASSGKNRGSAELKLVHNTTPSAVAIVSPENGAAAVSMEPTIAWTGGDDADGDTVFGKVVYGTNVEVLTMSTGEVKGKSITLPSANKLAANAKYFWQVVAYTKSPFCDTVKSIASSFTTAGTEIVITAQPAPTVAVIERQQLSLTVIATGTPAPAYQWYKDNVMIGGATGATISKSQVAALDAGSYHVVVSNGVGAEVVSGKSVVTVRFIAKITEDPQSKDVNEGGSVTFTAKTEGELPLSYLWLRDGTLITGANAASYTISSAATTDDKKSFKCVVSNSLGRDTSSAAVLSVVAKPEYQVNFDVDGGTTIVPVFVKSGEKVAKPVQDPSKQGTSDYGYEFAGWYTTSNKTTEFNFNSTIITGTTTIYAKWIVVYTVTFDAGNGTNPTTKTIKSPATTIGTLPTIPEKKSYVFENWYLGRNASGATFTTSTVVYRNLTVYANWEIRDKDENRYSEIEINGKYWMVENLRTTKFNNGDQISVISDSLTWYKNQTPACCWYENNSSNEDPYGALYNWWAVGTGRLAPLGWHVASEQEWADLIQFCGGTEIAGGKLKSTSSIWQAPNTGAEDTYGFAGLPGGFRQYDRRGTWFYGIGLNGFWWTSTLPFEGAGVAHDRNLGNDRSAIYDAQSSLNNGFSVRCVRD